MNETNIGNFSSLGDDSIPLNLKRKPRIHETIIKGFLIFSGALSILTTIGIVIFLGQEALNFFIDPRVSLIEFFTGTIWQPQVLKFGILPLLNATVMSSLIAMFVAIPIGIGAAIYLSEYASPRFRSFIKPILEILAGVPTVVLGFFALTFMTPLLRSILGNDVVQIYNIFAAGVVMGIFILPLISSMTEDALHAVPNSLRGSPPMGWVGPNSKSQHRL